MHNRKRSPGAPTPSMCMHALLGGQNKGATQRRMREGAVNDISSTYAMYIRMSQMYIAEMFGSVDSNGTEHLRFENAIALL